MIEQRSPEWYAVRLGKCTASRISDALATTKTGWGASRANYRSELVVERLTGKPFEGFRNADMVRGQELEPEGLAAYSFFANVDVEPVSFVDHPRIGMSGASPDGLVGTDGLVELKCPNTATHIETLLGGSVPGKYVQQVQWQMACTGRAWCDWVSYDPRMPEAMRLFIRRIKRDEVQIEQLERQVEVFIAEVAGAVADLRSRYALAEAA